MKTVLNSLLQIFPQIDMRILKAVANEFPMDVDTAVEFIFSDVIPIMSTEPVETSVHVHAHPALAPDAQHPATGMQQQEQQMEIYVLKKQGNKRKLIQLLDDADAD
ncbi:uncharacterized protein LOC121996256 isoform X1 [Zingiber officinale]|nr:uncharacterized protein LOC121996256 isoform X1 [Zingiber officinale]